ncbi:forkhead box protein N1 isoform X1 [Gallus gallus]|uniref:forkhead box protein N1 isoform X1 n=1 Tax=Gallus gallus TaxID=9031 RepID=UPI0000ECA5E2|nr:forkhead box protein N1 isoform X1 [Gallus gallus]XP_040543163.1 forkhead box protein N1 isoform X1 [Gallus gallus]|eukprot:XP_015151544.1 forkhead box protein N1 isoform X1 [Gallus gallus]
MVSLLQDQSNIKFSSSDALERDQQEDLMKTPGDSVSPVQQTDNPSYNCQPYESDSRTERKSSESSHSPSPASPAQDQLLGRYPPSQGIHCGKNKFQVSFSTEKFRRCSYEENTVGNYDRFLKSSRNPFHPYKRQISEDVFQEAQQTLPAEGPSFKNTRSIEGFEGLPGSTGPDESESFPAHLPNISSEQPWCNSLQYSTTGQDHSSQVMQDSDLKLRTSPLEGQPGLYCYQPQVQQMYCSSHPFHQYPSGGSYPVTYITSSHYPYQRIAPQSTQESQQPLFPKPIYSYSILIFMALKNSKTGSLPVSEIYNFMTEHFPYFKTAPDGWKNSVRHNLSLNKCFEKVENKSGNSSRKGCLWALNPAKIDKMQEELQKWKRKDPVAVRKSMAKPEELDTLIGDKGEKLRSSIMSCGPNGVAGAPLSRQMAVQPHSLGEPSLSSIPQPLHPIHTSSGALHAKNALPNLLGGQQTGCYTAPQGFPPISSALMPQTPDHQTMFPSGEAPNELRGQPSITQDSPLPAQTPPSCGVKVMTEHCTARTVPDPLLQEGDLSNDIDALNPSLTDFDLQGNLWEELKDDSLAVDPLVLISSSPTSSQCFPSHCQMENSNAVAIPNGTPHSNLPDLQLTTLYSAFMELDTVSPAYLGNPGSKPIALM